MSGVYKQVWDNQIVVNPENLLPNAEAGIIRAKQDSNFVYIEEVTYGRSLYAGDCNLTMAKERFFKANFAFAVSKDFPFTSIFNEKYEFIFYSNSCARPGMCIF